MEGASSGGLIPAGPPKGLIPIATIAGRGLMFVPFFPNSGTAAEFVSLLPGAWSEATFVPLQAACRIKSEFVSVLGVPVVAAFVPLPGF